MEGFGAKVLKSLCQSILDPPSENEQIPAKRTKNYNFVTPELTQERLEVSLVEGKYNKAAL